MKNAILSAQLSTSKKGKKNITKKLIGDTLISKQIWPCNSYLFDNDDYICFYDQIKVF